MSQDYVVIVCGIIFIALIVFGIINKIRKNGISSVVDDAVVIKVKEIVIKELGDILINAGMEANYEAFKNQVVYTLLGKVRAYIDEKGGLVDTITDAISDDAIIEALYQAIALSGMEGQIEEAYNTLITNRIKEMDEYDEKVTAENAALESAEPDPESKVEEPTISKEMVESDAEEPKAEKNESAAQAIGDYQQGIEMGGSPMQDY